MHLKRPTILLSWLTVSMLWGCGHFSTGSTRITPLYYLLKYDGITELPSELGEISGLTYDPEKEVFYTVNDEKGTIHRMVFGDTTLDQLHFGNDGDYEGIELVNGYFYVLESDGDLYKIPASGFDTRTKTTQYEKFPSIWDKCDAEGLGYMPSRNLLLIAFKKFKAEEGQKYIMGFDLAKNQFMPEPVFTIDVEEIANVLFNTPFERFSLKVNRAMAAEGPHSFFKPSGIAVHPLHDEIYVINGTNNLMAIFDLEMNLRSVHPLVLPEFRQPEGITFDQHGTLFISNEARGKIANILQFDLYE